MAKFEIDIGQSLDAAMSDFVAAWKTAERGDKAQSVDKVTFVDWGALCSVLTPKRYELLRHLRQNPADGVRALARALGRDVKRVHEDVVALTELGLVTRSEDGSLSSLIDEISSTIRIAA